VHQQDIRFPFAVHSSDERRTGIHHTPGLHELFLREGWTVNVLEQDLKTPIGRIRRFATADKVRELIDRTPTKLDLAANQAIGHALQAGRGGVYARADSKPIRMARSYISNLYGAIQNGHRVFQSGVVHMCVAGRHSNRLMTGCFLNDLKAYARLCKSRAKRVT
jgi:hypothetical protein